MRLIWQLVAVVAVAVVGNVTVMAVGSNGPLALVVGLAAATLALVVYAWVVRRTERRALVELARPGAAPAVARGTLLGVALCGAVMTILALGGGYTVHGLGSVSGALGVAGLMAVAAVGEELVFRGLLFGWVERRAGTWVALGLTSVLFGLVHLVNPNASLWGAVAITVEAGTMLGAAYIATRRLWLPIGLHFGWNVALGGLFGAEVSGSGTSAGLLDATLSGPAWATGGSFGPEGSLYAVLCCAATAVVFLAVARRRGRIVPRRRADRGDLSGDLAATLSR